MAFYDLNKSQRQALTETIREAISADLANNSSDNLHLYFSDPDTYVRKAAYLAVGRIFFSDPQLQKKIISSLKDAFTNIDEKVRQTVINAAGEIGMKEFGLVEPLMKPGLFDEHPIVRNAVIGSIKKMGKRNPVPVIDFARGFLHHENPEIRREICHGIELRGRTHPGDILPLLKGLQWDKTARVRNTLIHVIGQISYKKNCLAIVTDHLKTWENEDLVKKAVKEIIDVHERYKNFSALSQEAAKAHLSQFFIL